MRVLFVMRHSGFVRNFEALLTQLAERGHDIRLAFELPREQAELAERLAKRYSNLTIHQAPVRTDAWAPLAYDLRAALDALRYRTPVYAHAPKLAARVMRGSPLVIRWLTEPRFMRNRFVLKALDSVLRRMLNALPTDPKLDAFIAAQAPDRVLVTPLVAGSVQDDMVISARTAGIPTALPVTSWDNLTNKGLLRAPIDRVFVWNEGQRREAISLHGVRGERVVATGAHSYDHWFAWEPSCDRDEFCAKVGLPADRPIVLYLCSSGFIAPSEPDFVRRWLRMLREGPEAVRDASVLIRPHPASGRRWWSDVDFGEFGPVVIWPPVGADPRDQAAKSDYYDSMYHARAAVGINTSALIELAIVGRPAFTLLDPEFRDTQEGTLHFAHLTDTAGGILTTASTPDEHVDQLVAALASPNGRVDHSAFLHSFVRPHGLDRPAAPLLADEIERLAVSAPVPSAGFADAALLALMRPLRPLGGGGRRKGSTRAHVDAWLRRTRVRKRGRRIYRRTRRWAGRRALSARDRLRM
jgi:hypothetical protein